MKKNEEKNGTVLISSDGQTRYQLEGAAPKVDDYVGPAKEEEVEFQCGHRAPMFYAFTIHGEIFTISGTQLDEKLLCAKCLAKKEMKGATRCALCGKRIVSGKMVAVYRDGPMFRTDALRFKHDGHACVMGCSSCAPTGVSPAGRWDGKEFVPMDLAGDLLGSLIKELGLCSMCDSQTCPNRREPYTGQRQNEG